MWRHLRSVAFGIGLSAAAAPTRALAEPVSHAARSDDADTVESGSDGEKRRIDGRIQELRAERDDISRGGPIVLMSVGGAIGLIALAGGGANDSKNLDDGNSHPNNRATPYYIVSGISFAAAIGGLLLLIDCNRQKAELTDSIEQLEKRRRSSVALVPILEPAGGRAGLEVHAVF